jgi:LmbE family N-acetylglucosaminyl deacetylase
MKINNVSEKMNGKQEALRLMAILAHPDDESMGTGGILAKYASQGVETYLVTATRGERGWFGDESTYPGANELGRTREAELNAAAQVLGLKQVSFLGYLDGELDQADSAEVIARLSFHIRKIRPQVVVTFDPFGYYGHPDHIAISQFATAAMVAAAGPDQNGMQLYPPHMVSKLYYLASNTIEQDAFQTAFGELVMDIDGIQRHAVPWPDWAITTQIDTSAHWQQVWQAIACHRSQLPGYQSLLDLPERYHRQLWGSQTLYRAFSLVNNGRATEDDLFAGIRKSEVRYVTASR